MRPIIATIALGGLVLLSSCSRASAPGQKQVPKDLVSLTQEMGELRRDLYKTSKMVRRLMIRQDVIKKRMARNQKDQDADQEQMRALREDTDQGMDQLGEISQIVHKMVGPIYRMALRIAEMQETMTKVSAKVLPEEEKTAKADEDQPKGPSHPIDPKKFKKAMESVG